MVANIPLAALDLNCSTVSEPRKCVFPKRFSKSPEENSDSSALELELTDGVGLWAWRGKDFD